jgi:molybdopterin/thiamine biosynthesis adenylyltransferase/rhodanese-related sulfurtransferase
MIRYARQQQLPGIGPEGQNRLMAANVLVIGAGGLGCPVLSALAGAGVGRLIIVDFDVVEESNLHRQPLYNMSDIGRLKVEAAREKLLGLNPGIKIEVFTEKLEPQNVTAFVRDADIVVDAADSFAVTYILSDACANLKKPLVSGSALGFDGYVGLFCGEGPSYRAVFPDMPRQAANCNEAGVLGSTVAVLGSLQAHLVLHTLLRLSPPQYRLITFDGKNLNFGSFDFSNAREPAQAFPFITPDDVKNDDIVIDLRSLKEAPTNPFRKSIRIFTSDIETLMPQFKTAKRVVLACRSGLRSAEAANRLKAHGITNVALVALGDVHNRKAS